MSNEDEPVDLIASRLLLVAADGRRAEFTPDGIKIEGPNGTIDASFDSTGAPMLTLYTKDAQSSASIAASDGSAGIVLQTGAKSSSLVSAGLQVSNPERQRITLTDLGLTVKGIDGETLFAIPFRASEARTFISDLFGRLGGRLKAALSALTAPTE